MLMSASVNASIIDQSFLAPETGGARIGGTSTTTTTTGSAQAQTFTAGLTGTFDGATIVLSSFVDTTTDVSLSLYSVDGGGAPLAELGTALVNTATLLTPGVSTQVSYDFASLGLTMTAGTQYALVAVHGPGFGTSWRADPVGAGYGAGQRWSASYDTASNTFGSWSASPTWDFLFETRVVPEPATIWLIGPAALCLCWLRRRFS
jgi:hypothetical protein